jgi:hypothetical protein
MRAQRRSKDSRESNPPLNEDLLHLPNIKQGEQMAQIRTTTLSPTVLKETGMSS